MNIQIQPYSVTYDVLTIQGINVNLDNSASIIASLEKGDFYQTFHLQMDGQAYADWGSDDAYVVDWVLTQLGLTKA